MKPSKESLKKEKQAPEAEKKKSSQGTFKRPRVELRTGLFIGEGSESSPRAEEHPELKPMWDEMDRCLEIIREEERWGEHDGAIYDETGLRCRHCGKKMYTPFSQL